MLPVLLYKAGECLHLNKILVLNQLVKNKANLSTPPLVFLFVCLYVFACLGFFLHLLLAYIHLQHPGIRFFVCDLSQFSSRGMIIMYSSNNFLFRV